jgi:hypothetical protein
MTTLSKEADIGSLGLPTGDHWVKFHVDGEAISFEVAASKVSQTALETQGRKPTGFVERWGGTAKKIEDSADGWLTHINEKHLR